MKEISRHLLPELSAAHDALSDVLEDEDAGNDEVRDAAIEMCCTLNRLWETMDKSADAVLKQIKRRKT